MVQPDREGWSYQVLAESTGLRVHLRTVSSDFTNTLALMWPRRHAPKQVKTRAHAFQSAELNLAASRDCAAELFMAARLRARL